MAVLGLALAVPVAAQARVRSAESVLAPGQSGFVPPEGQPDNPRLADQIALFEAFAFKPAGFDQAGTPETPRAGVTITRDAYGVPSVRAGSQRDAWFGAGYAVAQDRLVELELFRRSAQGRLAEVLGESRLASDIVARRDFYTRAELRRQLRRLPAALRERFDAYAEGVNAWLARVQAEPALRPRELALLNVTPAPWTPLDSASIGAQLARTVPSGDGRELENWRALRSLGAATFDRLLPVHQQRAPVTVPAAEGRFPSQPGRTRRDETDGFAASRRFLRGLRPPKVAAATARAGRLPAQGGSFHYAFRGPGSSAYLFSAPQVGFSIPGLFVELEVHAPGLDVRGVTGPGIPVIVAGHNGRIAWGIASGLGDDDDLYVERLAGRERYRFEGRTLRMRCRTESFGVAGADSVRRRLCRTVHGPVQARRGRRTAYARRYAIWGREIATFAGLAQLNDATSVSEAGAALRRVTWNENTLVADDGGHIGWWHPGRLPLRPRSWDERLPLPGTGEAEWRGVLPFRALPKTIDPPQGFLANWNNLPSAGWTNGDTPAPETNVGDLHRGRYLLDVVRRAATSPSLATLKAIEREVGTRAQQRPLLDAQLRAAQAAALGAARRVLDAIVAWDGDYDRTDAQDTVDPGVAAFEALKDAAEEEELRPYAVRWLGQRGPNHPFDVGAAEAAALHALGGVALLGPATRAAVRLRRRFGSYDPAAWREPRRLYDVQVQGVAPQLRLEFFDRGTWSQAVELGP